MPETAMNKYHSLIMGKTMSGLPESVLTCRRYRNPLGKECFSDFDSGLVFLPRIPDIISAAMARSTMSAFRQIRAFSSSALVNVENSAMGYTTTVEVPPVIA